MYAVIEQGGKQFKVTEGDVIRIDLTDVSPDAKTIQLNIVLFVSDGEKVQIGTPYIDGAKVVMKFQTTAEEALVKGPKLYPTYFRRRKNSKRRIGHRQKDLQMTVDTIKTSKS